MSHGNVQQISAAEWSGLLNGSPQNTLFLEPGFLDLFEVPVRYWGLDRNGVIIAGLAIIDASDFGGKFLPWCYYQGIVFHHEIWRAAPAKRTQYEIELSEELVTAVARTEPRIALSLNMNLQDVRGLDWVHYHDADLPRVSLLPRYTAIIDLEDTSPETIRKGCRSARRQEEGYAKSRENLVATRDGTIKELYTLFEATFRKQRITLARRTLDMLSPYADHFLKSGAGQILTVRDEEGTAMAIALTFLDHDGTVHVPIVGVGDTRFGGTLLYFEILDASLQSGAKRLDFDGANSPKRSYFKHSMGARPQLYFEAHWAKK